MKKLKVSIFSLLFILFLSGINFSQTTHDVTVTNFSFSPGELTITVGDAVRWTNVLGTHNVKADDNSFTSGPAAPAPWEFTHTFTTVGLHPYYCEPHGGPGGTGMAAVVIVQSPVSVDDEKIIADKFELLQNYPNPFNPSTNIGYRISDRGFVSLKVYNILGDEIATLVNEEKEQGVYNITFDASGLSSGMYLYKLQAGSFVEMKKMIIIK
ncbi:MAG: T9SS type A sorting domain-containing protein [Ignavibacteriaceae bacterium]|nr:T9SS type A sorting domain-containing protein [Ignavibacteriaceae bacterium]